jgi:hypothetical protein
MTDKVNLKFDQHTTASEVLDQVVRARLQQISDGLAAWPMGEDRDVMAACKVLLDWMGNPHAQD